MKKDKVVFLIQEAMGSYKLLIQYIGADADKILLKWPDCFLSYITDERLFEKDIAILICHPIKIIIDVLVALRKKKYNDECNSQDADDLLKKTSNPVVIKLSLIEIANNHIKKLIEHGENIKEIPND
jgi:hypothetical protein